MLEIDIDIGRLLALFRNEAIEQQLVLGRIDAGNLEAITHRRIGGTAAPLAQDRRIDRARVIDDALDGEEIAREIELGDQPKLTFQCIVDVFGNASGIAPPRPLPGFSFQILLRRHAVRVDLFGVFVAQLVEAETAGISHLARGSNRIRPAREQALHFRGRFEMAFGIGGKQVSCLRNRGLVPDRRHHIVQRAPVRRGVMHVIGGQQGEAVRFG